MSAGAPTHRAWARRLVALAVGAAIVYAAFAALADQRALAEALATLPARHIALALLLVLGGYALRALRWHTYLRVAGAPMPARVSGTVFLAGLAMGVTPGKAGEAVKAYYLHEGTGAPYATTVPAVLAERLNDLLSVALLLVAGLFVIPSVGIPLGAGALVVVAGSIAVLGNERPTRALLRAIGRIRVAQRLVEPFARMHGNLRPLLAGGVLARSTALGVAAWGAEATAMWILALGMGIPLSWAACAFVFSAGSLAGVLSFVPGGLGVAEGGMVVLLALLGVALAPATALTLLVRLSTLWFGVAVGLLGVAAVRPTIQRAGATSLYRGER